MELYFNNNLSDITYLSELIPVALLRFAKQSEATGVQFALTVLIRFANAIRISWGSLKEGVWQSLNYLN